MGWKGGRGRDRPRRGGKKRNGGGDVCGEGESILRSSTFFFFSRSSSPSPTDVDGRSGRTGCVCVFFFFFGTIILRAGGWG
jgi:hypothetical protein